MMALPALGGLGSIGMLAMAPKSVFIYVAGGLFFLTSVSMAIVGFRRHRQEAQHRAGDVRKNYRRELADVAEQMATTLAAQRTAGDARIEYGALMMRVGVRAMRDIPAIQYDVADDADPYCRDLGQAVVDEYRAACVESVEFAIGDLKIAGDPDRVREFIGALVATAVRHLAPETLKIAVLTENPARWAGLRWVAHHRHDSARDASGAMRLVASTAPELTALLSGLTTPILLIVDHDCVDPPAATWRLRVVSQGADVAIATDGSAAHHDGSTFSADLCGAAGLSAVARRRAGGIHRLTAHRGATAEAWLRPIIGQDLTGRPVVLDLREAGDGGDGPHGLVIGATGAGKSELLKLIVSSLMARHTPAELVFAFVDFKGGATFDPFDGAGHVAASITNLDDAPGLIFRAKSAIAAELAHRQRVLKEHRVATIRDLPPGVLPRMLIIVDEFSELIVQEPEMIDALAQVGRLGRSLGVHLLVASQRLEEGRLKGLDSHLSYRIALRTQTTAESRAVIGTPDAAALPMAPGHGYLAVAGEQRRFRAALSTEPRVGYAEAVGASRVVPLRYQNGPEVPRVRNDEPSILDEAIAAGASTDMRARPMWVNPPTSSPRLTELIDDLECREGRGFGTFSGRLEYLPIGLVDRPDRQAVETYALDLSAGRGHVGIVGSTRTGATGLARTLLISSALAFTPKELALYLFDFAGGGLRDLMRLPHTVAMCEPSTPEVTRQSLAHLRKLVTDREHGEPQTARVFVVIDGITRLRDQDDSWEPTLIDLGRRGLRVGVHLICTANRWFDLRPAMRDLLGTRLELRIADPLETEIDRKAAALVPRGRPGRGLTADGHPLYVAHEPAQPRDLVDQIAANWTGPRARGPIQVPPRVPLEKIPSVAREAGLCLAVDRATAATIALAAEPRFSLLVGDPRSGRSSILRSLIVQEGARGTKLVVLDPRRSLIDIAAAEGILGYAPTVAAAVEAIDGLCDGLQRRLPTADLEAHQLKDRGWWSGSPVHLIIDDYDVLTLDGNLLAGVRRFLPYAADIDLRVTVARRSAGAGRAVHDEVLSVMRDLGQATLVLANTSGEGPIFGVAPDALPPGRGTLVLPGQSNLQVQAISQHPVSESPAGEPGEGRS